MDGRKNFAYTTLNGAINTTDNTAVPVVDASRLPDVPFNCAVYDGDNPEIEFDAGRLEFIRVTAKDTGANTITFTRNTENGALNSFASGARVDATITADTFDRLDTDINNATIDAINGTTEKTALVTGDKIPLSDSEASNVLKWVSPDNLGGGGAMELVSSTELASAAAIVEFTGLDFTAYKYFVLSVYGVYTDGAGLSVFQMQFSNDNGSTYLTTSTYDNQFISISGTSTNPNNPTVDYAYCGRVGNSRGGSLKGTVKIYNDGGVYPSILSYMGGGNTPDTVLGSAIYDSATFDLDAVRVKASDASNFAIGSKFYLYGVK